MTWLTQSSLAEFRSVFGNTFNIDRHSLCLSVSLRSNRHKKVCLFLLFYFSLLDVLISFMIWVFCNNNNNVLVFLKKNCLGFLRREQMKCKGGKGGSFFYIFLYCI